MDAKVSNKRTHNNDFPEEQEEIKRSKIDIGLLDLSDCVLTLIFEYVNSFDLYALSLTCTRFNYLIPAKKLWSKVDVRSNPMCARKFKFFYANLNDSTKCLMVSGINPHEKCITNYQFHRLPKITSNLSVLAMEYQFIYSNEIQLRHFPAGLKELSLRGTHVDGCISIFQEASVQLKNLHTLILDECDWVGEHSLMALSKFANLENLSVYKCKNLRDSVAYMSVTTRFGFKKLLRFDARLTLIGDQFLKCLNNLRSIREIYLEAPAKRDKWDYIALKRIHRRRNIPAPMLIRDKGKKNRASTFCLEEFRACTKDKCSFKPADVDCGATDEVEEEKVDCGNVIVVSPFEVRQSPDENDVRVHVLYGNEAPFQFERQTNHNNESTTNNNHNQDDDDDDDCELDLNDDQDEDDGEEILYNNVRNYEASHFHSRWFDESTVSDDGIRWFTASGTTEIDDLGQESLLFRRPFSAKCECAKQCHQDDDDDAVDGHDDWDKPGPSGLNRQEQNDDNNGVVEPIISIRRRPFKIAIEHHHRNPNDRRDLRVVIERVEPGIQIIVNNHHNNNINNNNNNNAMLQNNLTRLKVFVVRNFNRLSDRVMHNLSGIRLELLDVTRTSISADAVKRFLLLNPDCRVIHESTCRCVP